MDSIFTKIIKREIPANIIYEDEATIAFFTIEPVQKGHTLVVPKEPFENIFDGDEEALANLMKVAKRIAPTIQKITGADGVNLIMNNGAGAGQEVFHAHLHVVPRFLGDEAFTAKKTAYTDGEAVALAEMIRAAL
jgi:histidine triad (HIT) family protein